MFDETNYPSPRLTLRLTSKRTETVPADVRRFNLSRRRETAHVGFGCNGQISLSLKTILGPVSETPVFTYEKGRKEGEIILFPKLS